MRNLEKGQHIFIAFQDGKAVLDSQLRPRIYTSLENADKWTPTVNKGKIEYVEYAPTLTPPNEWVSVEDAVPDPGVRVLAANGNFVGEAYMASNGAWMRHDGFPWKVDAWIPLPEPPDRRPPEGETDEE